MIMLKPLKHFLQTFSVYIILSFYVYFTYHWLIIPLALEGGLWGILAIVLGIIAFFWIAPKDKRLPYAIFAFLLLFLDKALQGTDLFNGMSRIWAIVLLSAVVWLIGRLTIRLPNAALGAVVFVALFFYLLWPREDVRLWTEFRVADVTSPLYVGKRSDYFPLYLERNATTGLDRIIVYGNREEQLGQDIHANALLNENMTGMPFKTNPMDLEANKKTYFLGPEIIRPYALSWDHVRLKREPLSPQEEKTWERQLMRDYPGFPYFVIKNGMYEPLIERDALAERILNFGQSPYLALTLDALHLADDLKARSGYLDEKPSLLDGAFTSLRLMPNHLEGYYHQKPFKLATKATQIIGAMRVEDEDVLVLLGQTLDLVAIEKDGQPFVTHRLSSQELPDLFTADYLIAPLPGEGDVLFLSFPTDSKETAKILKPLPGGSWRVLFSAKDPLFRFEDVRIQNGQTTILALPTSRFSNYPQRYLAEYTYENGKLVYHWKVFYSLINVRYAKLWAEDHGPLPWMRSNDEAIVGMRYGDHRLYVLTPHHLPVYPLLIGSNALIFLSLLIIRWREHLPQRMMQTKKGGSLHLKRLGFLMLVLIIILTGCSEPSFPSSTIQTAIGTEKMMALTPPSPKAMFVSQHVDARKTIEAALNVMEDETLTKSFWYTGYIRNTIHKRKTTSMFSGTYLRPARTAMDARMAAIPYRFYRDGEAFRYIWTPETDWLTVKSLPVSVHPFSSFTALLPFFNDAEQWDDEVLGLSARAYRTYVQADAFLSAWEAYRTSYETKPLGDTFNPNDEANVLKLLSTSDILLTLWLQDDPTLHQPRIVQLEAVLLLPIPAAGYSMQEVFFRFFQFNDPSIRLKPPSDIERYLKDDDETTGH